VTSLPPQGEIVALDARQVSRKLHAKYRKTFLQALERSQALAGSENFPLEAEVYPERTIEPDVVDPDFTDKRLGFGTSSGKMVPAALTNPVYLRAQ
jgi:hypothetical protein